MGNATTLWILSVHFPKQLATLRKERGMIQQALGVSVDHLLGIKDIKGPAKTPNQRVIRRLERIEELPKRDQDALLRIIDAFLAKSA